MAKTVNTTITPEGRLIDSGWIPPNQTLREVIERREVFRSAIAGLRSRGHADLASIATAIGLVDRDAIITAAVTHALGEWLDLQCGRPYTALSSWSATAEQALLDAIYAAPQDVLASLEGIESDDAAYLRSEATRAVTPNASLLTTNGRPSRVRPAPLSMSRVMIPR